MNETLSLLEKFGFDANIAMELAKNVSEIVEKIDDSRQYIVNL